MLFFFLKLKCKREPTWKAALLRVDWLGNAIFIPSILAILLGIVMGGTTYPWNSWHVVVSIVLGGIGWALFHVHQASPIFKEPSVPPRLFANCTSCVGFLLACCPSSANTNRSTEPALGYLPYPLDFSPHWTPIHLVQNGSYSKFLAPLDLASS